ncbi:MAG: MG2 domain-containing protein [Planctomycetia bacterium]|nr:MG2 domain-containing protein [Planctomycetia bacterium]
MSKWMPHWFVLAFCVCTSCAAAENEPSRPSATPVEQAHRVAHEYMNRGEYLNVLTLVDVSLFGSVDGDAKPNAFWTQEENSHQLYEMLVYRMNALRSLGRMPEADAFLEKFVRVYAREWRAIQAAARIYSSALPSNGRIISGEFSRAPRTNNGQFASCAERDRVRALQLMSACVPLVQKEKDSIAAGWFFISYADFILELRRMNNFSWELQDITDLSKLPDYETTNPWGNPRNTSGAAVDEDGMPIFFHLPESFEDAKNDGERWRWCLEQARVLNRGVVIENFDIEDAFRIEALFRQARFYQELFGVQTLARLRGRFSDDNMGEEMDRRGGILAVGTLKDTETTAQLASGVKRFSLPEEFNHVLIWQEIAKTPNLHTRAALDALANIMKNRRQFPRTVEYYRQLLETNLTLSVPPAFFKNRDSQVERTNESIRQELNQITGNWGRFEPLAQQTSANPTASFRSRNATKVSFSAYEVDVDKFYAALQQRFLEAEKKSPFPANQFSKVVDHRLMNIQGIASYLIRNEMEEYLKPDPIKWDVELTPAPDYADSITSISLPFENSGIFFIKANVENGNECCIIARIADTTIVRKTIDEAIWYYVADAQTGEPIANAEMNFFGVNQSWLQEGRYRRNPHRHVRVKKFSIKTDENGAWIATNKDMQDDYQWSVCVVRPGETKIAAELGFNWNQVWFARKYDEVYDQMKTFPVTDRPVYRPEQTVHYKFWIAGAKYERKADGWTHTTSAKTGRGPEFFANQKVVVRFHNPNGEEFRKETVTTNEFGAFSGTLELPKDARLGQYQISVQRENNDWLGNAHFRVEEYKKPEFEVKVDAPSEPVMLGEKIEAKIEAKYYFGAPVSNGVVKYKVTREDYRRVWYAPGPWDWLFGQGYWWSAPNYVWFPGWGEWGCPAPRPSWDFGSHGAPEIVMEGEIQLTEAMEGKATIEVDTAIAHALYPDRDHKYTISAEVTDESRRMISGSGNVLVARRPFRIYAWSDRGYYRVGQQIRANFKAKTLSEKPVSGDGIINVFELSYDEKGTPSEKLIHTEKGTTDAAGDAMFYFKATNAGQYRISFVLTTREKTPITQEGAILLTVQGEGFNGENLRFNDLELIPDKSEYKPGETLKLLINTDRANAMVILFPRATNGVCARPLYVRMNGKSQTVEIPIGENDQPNFFIEATTTYDTQVYSVCKEIFVPPVERILTMEITPSKSSYLPGENAKAIVTLRDENGEPFVGDTVVTVYDKSVEYISGGSNVPDIYPFFWGWKRSHQPQSASNAYFVAPNLFPNWEQTMVDLGVFGNIVQARSERKMARRSSRENFGVGMGGGMGGGMVLAESNAAMPMMAAAPAAAPRYEETVAADEGMAFAAEKSMDSMDGMDRKMDATSEMGAPQEAFVEASVRANFADTAFWRASIVTDKNGSAEIEFPMPENLTTWKIRAWAIGSGSRVGKAESEIITTKNLIIRMQTPRFMTTSDEIVLSANVHNYLAEEKKVEVSIALEEDAPIVLLEGEGNAPKRLVTIPANGELRVDWRVRAEDEGTCVVQMSALTNEESDAMKLDFPIQIHGMLKQEARSGMIGISGEKAQMSFVVPEARREADSRMEIRFSPTLAGAILDALPYLADYPYGCTEQTLNRFLPAVLTRKTLSDLGIDLNDIREKSANLNAQEMGDPTERAKQWKKATRLDASPVFDDAVLAEMVEVGAQRLANMQCSDGGWGWFSGYGEHSSAHLTAYVTRGLMLAKQCEVDISNETIDRGIQWLRRYQAEENAKLARGLETEPKRPFKRQADNMDALVYSVLAQTGDLNDDMRKMGDFLFRDRVKLSHQSNAFLAIAFIQTGQNEKAQTILDFLAQFIKIDEENQTAFLALPADCCWWYWYGNNIETQAMFLQLLCMADTDAGFKACVDAHSNRELAAYFVKYLLNNRKNATYWNSTRDTALVVEAMTYYLRRTNELAPNMSVEVYLDGELKKTVEFTRENLFSADNSLILAGEEISGGEHVVELRRSGSGPVYFNGYVSFFTLEDFITKAGLEVKVERKFYRLERVEATRTAAGARGQVVKQAVEKYERIPLESGALVKSGDLIEVELSIESKNDYTYLMFEDMKPAGFEAVDVRSGYNGNPLGAYVEYRDNRVVFFVNRLAEGKHSVSYRLRAETPGSMSALPTRCEAMYAPELRANSDEMKIRCED